MKQAEERVLGLQDRGEDLEQISKDYDTLQKYTQERSTQEMWDTMKNQPFSL